MSKFQIILLGAFSFFIVIAVAVFSLYRAGGGGPDSIRIWGDISSQGFYSLIGASNLNQDQSVNISYEAKSLETIDSEFTEALAQGIGPDLIVLTQENFLKNKPKLLAIPYQNVSERDFQMTFIEEGELFLDQAGIYALPLVVDPLVLYYNRDLLSNVAIAKPLAYWDEIYTANTNLSKRDAAGNLITSTMALGEAVNIPNYKDIFSLLMLQAGTSITGFVGSNFSSLIASNFGLPIAPSVAALDFYTQFSNPTKVFYSWNRSLTSAQTHFASGDSAYYLGFASELSVIRSKNPTLNFGVVPVPQSRVSGKTITFGRLHAVAISRGTKNPALALTVAKALVSKNAISALSESLNIPPARRDLLAERPVDPISSVFYEAALQSKGWLDPDPKVTGAIFREAIESVTSGRARTTEAIGKVDKGLEALIK